MKLRLSTVDFPQSLKGMRKGKLRSLSGTTLYSNSIFFSGEFRPSDKRGRPHKNVFRPFGPQFSLWVRCCFYTPYHFDMIFSLLLCISPWKQQHLAVRVNIQVANQPFLLWFEETSNTLNLLFWQRLFAVEGLAARIIACSSHWMKSSKKHGWKQVLLLLSLFLCQPPRLQLKLGFSYCAVGR